MRILGKASAPAPEDYKEEETSNKKSEIIYKEYYHKIFARDFQVEAEEGLPCCELSIYYQQRLEIAAQCMQYSFGFVL